MATYSTNLALTLMATGEQSNTWGDTTNTNLGTLLEQAISGYVTQAITDGSSANTTITIPNGATGVARNMFIEMTGALTFSTTSLIVPANKKMYFIFNNTTGGFAVTVKVSGQTGVSVPNGKKMVLVSNGTDIVNAENYIASLSVGALTSGRVPYAGTAGLLQDSANLTFNGTTLTANTIGAFTLGGTVAGGGNQLNNVIIGTTTPLAGAFTTLSATGLITGRSTNGQVFAATNSSNSSFSLDISSAKVTFSQLASAGTLDTIIDSTIRTSVSSTGLAVTGTLSATGDISLPTTNQLGWGASPFTCAIEGASGASGYIRFATNNAFQMLLDASGNLGVRTQTPSSSPASGFVFQPAWSAANNGAWAVGHASGSAGGSRYGVFLYNSGEIGSITQSGTTAVAYNTSSDYRLKENIAPMTGALAKVALLKPCTYTWKAAPEEIGEGFIAHELAEVCPHAVTGEKDATAVQTYEISPAVPATFDEEGNELTAAVEAVMGEREVPRYQGIDTSFLVATLTAAIQEQQAIITALTTRITALENK